MASRPLKRIDDSRLSMAEIVGEESLAGQRMQAGAILDLIDIIGGRIANRHAASAVTTLSFDRVDLVYPILHLDLIQLDGNILAVGNSSMLIAVQGYRKDTYTRRFMPIQRAYMTFVAVDEQRRPNRDIPGLSYRTPEEDGLRNEAREQQLRSAAWVRMQQENEALGGLRAADVEDDTNRGKSEYVSPAGSEITVRRMFMPKHVNQIGTIFGGDILHWMDKVAIYTARHFTRNRSMVTIAMNRIFFKQPIFPTDTVEMVARVVYVRTYTLEVEIRVRIERSSGEQVESHSGYFTVFNYDESGFKRPILTGLRLADEDQDGLRRYLQARERHRFWNEREKARGARD
ncbi:MAG: acyl-CoA thioesterase [Candidatus Lambdaproteobacteria bacterium]|nr:acyl-CoA thioesterase [Candidatus Lambdaproteobacteria bacterium]